MRIACPSCNATYDVPDGVVAAGRTLRCSRCATDFVARAPVPPVPDPPPAALRLNQAERFAATTAAVPMAGRPAKLVLAAWALSIGVIGAAVWAAIAWRAPIMQAWPPCTRVYAALGYLH